MKIVFFFEDRFIVPLTRTRKDLKHITSIRLLAMKLIAEYEMKSKVISIGVDNLE